MADHSRETSGATIGVVTVLYQSDDVVEGFVESLALQTEVRFKLYVIDNSPQRIGFERCRQLVAKHGIDAEFVYNNANLGVAKGNNQGIELALRDGCRYVLLANNDTEFAAGTFARLMQPLQEGERVVSPKILYDGPGRLIWYVGGHINAWAMRTPHIGMQQPDRGQYDHVRYTRYAPTCFVMLDAELFRDVGMMDERYFVYYDDTDFMWRLNRRGVRIRMVPEAVVIHKVSSSTGGGRSPFTLYYSNRNRIYFIRKNLRGVQGAVALAYTLLTRIPTWAQLPRAAAARMWAGVKDGLRGMPVNGD